MTTMAISDIGILSAMSQAITEATLCLTADAGKMAMPMCASTSETTVESSAAVSDWILGLGGTFMWSPDADYDGQG
jgi:hypothetical protein